jgi:tetratricopeptide (TPR) repeat protein
MASARFLTAQDPKAALANLSDLNRGGQLLQVIDAANSLLATDKLTPAYQGMVFVYLGHAYQQRGEFTKATANYEKALTLINRDGQHPSDYATTLGALATVYAQTGQFDTAKHMFRQSIRLYENDNDHEGAAMIWDDLATIAADQHSRKEAHKYMKRSVAESQLAGNMTPGELAALATTEARIAELDGDPRTAILRYQQALDLWKQTNKDQQQRIAWLYVLLSGAYLQSGDLTTACETVTRGLTMLEAISGRQTVRYLTAQLTYSKILDASGAHDEASTLRKEAQAGLNTGTDRQHTQSQISISALR